MKIGDSNRSSQTQKTHNTEVKKDNSVSKDKAKVVTTQDKPKLSFHQDGFEAAKAVANTVAKTVANTVAKMMANTAAKTVASTATTATTASTTSAAAQKILDTAKNNPNQAAHDLGVQLKDPKLSQAEKEAIVTEIIEKDPHTAAQILNEAGKHPDITSKVTAEDTKAISQTLGQAWDHSNPAGKTPAMPGTSGYLDAADLRAVLSPANMNAHPAMDPQPSNIGAVFAASGSSSLERSASTQMYNLGKEIAAGNSVDGTRPDYVFKDSLASSYYAGSALAASASPEASQALMNHVALGGSDAVKDFVKTLSPTEVYKTHGPDAAQALGKLMQAVSNLPATPAADQFFDQAVAVSRGEGSYNAEQGITALQKGLSQYFQTNMEHTTTRWASSNQISDRTAYAHFAANVLFGDSFDGQKDLQKNFATSIGKRAGELQGMGSSDPALEEKSRQLGFLIGGAEVGFQRALGFVKDRNKARDAMVDFVFDLATAAGEAAVGGKIPNFTFGPINVKNTLTQGIKDQIHKWVNEKEPSANEMTRPLYELGLSITNDYQDEMLSVRGSFSDDERNGYLTQ